LRICAPLANKSSPASIASLLIRPGALMSCMTPAWSSCRAGSRPDQPAPLSSVNGAPSTAALGPQRLRIRHAGRALQGAVDSCRTHFTHGYAGAEIFFIKYIQQLILYLPLCCWCQGNGPRARPRRRTRRGATDIDVPWALCIELFNRTSEPTRNHGGALRVDPFGAALLPAGAFARRSD
jgi:hypothetical protein